jgi:hypothetical protein
MKQDQAQTIANAIEQMRYEYDQILYGEGYINRLERIEDCAREIINLVEKIND